MKKLTTLKTLLVGLCVMGATSAWADDVASHDFDKETTPFVIYDANRLSVSYPEYVEDGGDCYAKYTCGNMNAVAFAYYNYASGVTDASTVTVEFDFNIATVAGHVLISLADADVHTAANGGFTGKSNTGYGTNGALFNLGCWRANNTQKFAINSTQNDLAGLDAWCHASITVDNANRTVDYTITKGGSTLASGTGVSFLNSNAVRCSQVDIYIGTNANGNAVQIDNLIITKTVSSTDHNYTINAVSGGTTIRKLAEGVATESSAYGTFIQKYLMYNNQYYVLDDANISNFYAGFTMGQSDETKEVNYTVSAIDYFFEAENMSNSRSYYGSLTDNNSCSNGRAVGIYSGASQSTSSKVGAGAYTISGAASVRRAGDQPYRISYSTNGTDWIETGKSLTFASNSSSASVESVMIPSEAYIRLIEGNGNNAYNYLDYITLQCTGVSKTISDAGYATYCSPYALDFSRVEGLTAYIATLNGTEVSFSAVTNVPTNTGVLLKGAAGSYEIPVITSSSTDVTNNALEGVTEETVINGAGIFVLMNGSEGVGFYKTTAESFTVGANTAYIPALEENPSRNFIAIDETTAIKAIETAKQISEIYNLAGQRVKSAQKGLYIIDGKKVVIK